MQAMWLVLNNRLSSLFLMHLVSMETAKNGVHTKKIRQHTNTRICLKKDLTGENLRKALEEVFEIYANGNV